MRLLSGAIRPGERLVDHAIAAELGVSRMPVREALMQLVAEGYLTSTTRGFALPDLAPARIAEVFTLRRLLEPHAAALAAQTLAPTELEALRFALNLLQTNDVSAFHRAAEAFRNTWIAAVPNLTLRETIQRQATQIQAVRLATMHDPGARATIAQGLAALLDAFQARDALKASDQMLRFIHQAEEAHNALTKDTANA